jgi:intergrase/recombinase
LNPRRPTPSGPKPVEEMSFYSHGIERFYPRHGGSEDKPISGKSDVGQVCISLSDSLLEEFSNWLRNEEGTSDRTVRDYVNYLKKALGLKLCSKEDVSSFFDRAGMNKRSYESLRRFLSFVERKKSGYESLVQQLRKALPKKPRSGADTYVPPDSKILELRDRIKAVGEPYYTIYSILVSTGCRLSEAVHLLRSFNAKKLVKVTEDVYRYHIDLQRKSKNVLVMYLPREVAESIMKLDKYVPQSLKHVAEVFERNGLAAKYLRKWFRQTLKKLKIDSEVIEFLQGRVTALGIGAKHYTDLIALADEVYPRIVYPHIKAFL